MDPIIKRATENDFDKAYPLFFQLWPGKILDKNALKTVFCRGVISDKDELLCLYLGNEMIGFCAYAIVNNFWQEGLISYMYAMVIDEKYRGKGYGTMLIQEAIRSSKHQGMKRLELDSAFHREKAHEFYSNLGFEKRAYLFSHALK